MISVPVMQKPVLAQTSGPQVHVASDMGLELFDSPRLHSVQIANRFPPPRSFETLSTPRAPCQSKLPPLLKSLAANDLRKVRECLSADSLVANTPFWDHDVEPPLCAAVRLRCDTCIVKALLDSDADPEAIDSHGRTPLMIATSLWSELPEPDLPFLGFPQMLVPQLFPATEDQLQRAQDRLQHAQATVEVLKERLVGPCSTDLTSGIGATRN